jgi:hypothetical protein
LISLLLLIICLPMFCFVGNELTYSIDCVLDAAAVAVAAIIDACFLMPTRLARERDTEREIDIHICLLIDWICWVIMHCRAVGAMPLNLLLAGQSQVVVLAGCSTLLSERVPVIAMMVRTNDDSTNCCIPSREAGGDHKGR